MTPSPAPEPTDSRREIESIDTAAGRPGTRFDDRSRTTPERPPVEAVSAALASLANGTAPRSVDTESIDHRRVVWTARRAMRRVETAAAWLSDGGLARLREAVRAARRRGDEDVARRGQAVLDSVTRYRRVAATQRGEGTADDGGPRADERQDGAPGVDRSRGTILPGGGQTADR